MTLFDRRKAYEQVIIETSGLADPSSMLQVMMTDRDVLATHQISGVVTLVDTVHGELTLAQHAEARNQVALADVLLISKTDLTEPADRLLGMLDDLNPAALRMRTTKADPSVFFSRSSPQALSQRLTTAERQRSHGQIDTFTVTRDKPLPALALTLLLQAIAEHCGPRLLRLKGLVAIQEMPGQPAIIHGVRHVVSPPDFLDRWPSADETTRIVFITKDVPRYFISRLLDAIEEEVRDAMAA
jgi:G3E family GTPase